MAMEKFRLKNGLTVIFQKNSSDSVAIEAMFKVGSNYEKPDILGISHFLEHMLFEGTKKRPDSVIIANEIEKYGAEFNAYTSSCRTAFFIKIINKRFDIAIDILSDMFANSIFRQDKIEKEKKVVLREIDMLVDDPRQHQWVLFQKNLFEKHPARNPTCGTAKTVKSLNRKKLADYCTKYYAPNNMILSIVGNVENVRPKIEEYFGSLKLRNIPQKNAVNEPTKSKKCRILI